MIIKSNFNELMMTMCGCEFAHYFKTYTINTSAHGFSCESCGWFCVCIGCCYCIHIGSIHIELFEVGFDFGSH